MTATTTHSDTERRSIRRGRLIALALFGIALIPVVLATAMYFGGWGVTGAAANKGELIQPVAAIGDLGLRANGEPLESLFIPARDEARWLLLTLAPECSEACRNALHQTRQVHVALGKDQDRVDRAFWSAGNEDDIWPQYPHLQRLQLAPGSNRPAGLPGNANLEESHQIYIVDPHGNVILRYDQSNSGEDLLKDLKRLLRVSNIG